jgi:hypothetical protein
MRLLEIGYEEIRCQIKQLYRVRNKSNSLVFSVPDGNLEKVEIRKKEKALSRILSGIQVSWAEESIKRLFYEPNLFTDQQRNYLLERPALDQRWYATLHMTYCIAYDLVPTTNPLCTSVDIEGERWNLGNELVDQYFELRSIIGNYLTPNFSIRNKVQHGEWEFAFKNNSKEFSMDTTLKIQHENLITTASRFTIVNALYQMLVDLGRFKSNSFKPDSMRTPFEYFYGHYIKKINYEIKKIVNPKLEEFIVELLEREVRGEKYRIRTE